MPLHDPTVEYQNVTLRYVRPEPFDKLRRALLKGRYYSSTNGFFL